ncbi:MAG: radical SAM protein, partial [Candidatus Eisenbacteria bacterium]|nr:radical SAM protein [Candidatus Eisenbacteria bacterium]
MTPVLEKSLRRGRLLFAWASGGASRFVPPPRMAQIEVTNRCNLACRTCTRLKLPLLGDMSYEDFCTILDRIGRVRLLWLSGQGEPLLHPELPRMIRACADRGIRNTILHTNATLLRGEMARDIAASGLGEMRVSIDGGSAEEMEYLRVGASFREVLENVRAFVPVSY